MTPESRLRREEHEARSSKMHQEHQEHRARSTQRHQAPKGTDA